MMNSFKRSTNGPCPVSQNKIQLQLFKFMWVCMNVCIIYPPTSAVTKAGAPQVWNLFLSACLQTLTTLRGSLHQALHSRRSSLPFASLQTPKMLVRAFKPAVCLHSPLRSSLPFASLQTRKIPRGSFDEALWPQAFVVRAFKPAVCQPSNA